MFLLHAGGHFSLFLKEGIICLKEKKTPIVSTLFLIF